jgi:hypothetical protein
VPPIAGPSRQDQLARPPQRADRAAGEQAERRRPPSHAREVTHQGAFELLIRLAFRLPQPKVETLFQIRRGDEERLADLGSGDDSPEAPAQARPVFRQGSFQPCRVAAGRGGLQAIAPGQQLIERQKGRAQGEEARGSKVVR